MNPISHDRQLFSRKRKPESISVVTPCFNEEEVLHELRFRLTRVLSDLALPYEIVAVDDGSTDSTWAILRKFQEEDPTFKIIRLSRNRGQQAALTCGLDHARGEVVLILDADLQDPPELVRDMITKWQEGFDVVYGKRLDRLGERPSKRLFAHLFYRLFDKLAAFEFPKDTGDFRLLDRRVVDALQNCRETHRFLRGMVSWIGFPQTAIEYQRPARFAGETKFPFRKSLRLALDGLFSFSTAPLRFSTYLGGTIIVASLLSIVATLALRIAGYAGVIAAFDTLLLFFIGGVQLLTIGILGEYVGRTFEQSQDRPLYLIDQIYGEPLSQLDNKVIRVNARREN